MNPKNQRTTPVYEKKNEKKTDASFFIFPKQTTPSLVGRQQHALLHLEAYQHASCIYKYKLLLIKQQNYLQYLTNIYVMKFA